jgi:hemoglobin
VFGVAVHVDDVLEAELLGEAAGQRVRKITDEQRERFVELYLEALDEAGLPRAAAFREAVREHVEFGAQVAQQNSHAENDGRLHPIRHVPSRKWPKGSGN